MRTTIFAAVSLLLLADGPAMAAGGFNGSALRGRYTGNLTIDETIPVDQNTTLKIAARQLLALTFDGKSAVTGITSVTASVSVSPPTTFTCVFMVTGTYQVGDEGLGTAELAITPTTDCAGPASLKMSLLVGGRGRNRIDVTIDGARGPNGEDPGLLIVGSGVLVEQ